MQDIPNKVQLVGHYGSDIIHACSGWTSTCRDLTEDRMARIPKFLAYLAEHEHETPFEKSALHFLVTTDIASHIHILKHRIGVSVNAESARYKELQEDKYYLPVDWANIKAETDSLKLNGNAEATWLDIIEQYTRVGNRLYHDCVTSLTPVLGRKRAKESARFFKTYNSQIESDVMFNWRSFAHFQYLRNSPKAQLEIRIIAQEMLRQVRDIEGNPFKDTIIGLGLDQPDYYGIT